MNSNLGNQLEEPAKEEPPQPGQSRRKRRGRSPRWKRFLDLTIVLFCLPLLSPIFIVVALWIRFTSKGAIIFRQERIGYGGEAFTFYKFRSMREDVATVVHECHLEKLVDSGRPMTKLDDLGDPRVIPGGNLLRSSGLDELPQLYNVVRGEMSLVGPRPCTAKEFKLYREDQKRRFKVVPGLTGYWQVNGKNATTFAEMIALDDHYVEKRSLWLDLLIILRTPFSLLAEMGRTVRKRLFQSHQSEKPAKGWNPAVTPETKN